VLLDVETLAAAVRRRISTPGPAPGVWRAYDPQQLRPQSGAELRGVYFQLDRQSGGCEMTNPAKATVEYGRIRREAADCLKTKSVIAFGVERTFRGLQCLSPASHLSKPIVELYLLLWLVIALALGGASYFPVQKAARKSRT
jgi:hypothetical protein